MSTLVIVDVDCFCTTPSALHISSMVKSKLLNALRQGHKLVFSSKNFSKEAFYQALDSTEISQNSSFCKSIPPPAAIEMALKNKNFEKVIVFGNKEERHRLVSYLPITQLTGLPSGRTYEAKRMREEEQVTPDSRPVKHFRSSLEINPVDFLTARDIHSYNITPLHKAVMDKNYDLAVMLLHYTKKALKMVPETLLNRCFTVNTQDVFGRTALHFAVSSGHYALTRLLLENGALNIADSKGITPLHLAAHNGDKNCAEMILDTLSDEKAITIQDEKGMTALHHAVTSKSADVVELLLRKNIAMLDLADNEGYTPFELAWKSLAVGKGTTDIAVYLLSLKLETCDSLSLEHCRLGNDSIQLIANSLAFNHTCTSLDLSDNSFDDTGARELLRMLDTNQTITELDIGHNDISSELCEAIEEKLNHNLRLKSSNNGDSEGARPAF